jgi:2'-5' RNA ligase
MSDLIRSAPNAVRADADLPEGVLKFVLCKSDETDAHNSRILPQGCDLSRHRTNPVFLWQHQSGTNAIGAAPGPEVVIGKVTEYQQDDKELVITVLFDLEDDLAATCYRKCKQGFLNGVSIGCRVDADAARIEKIDGIEVTIYPKSTLLEASLVILPSLGSALRVDRAAAATLLRSLGGAESGDATDRAVPAAYADHIIRADNVVRESANNSTPSSAMLALYPSIEVARSIAVPGGYPPEDLHLTLACFDALPAGGADRLEVVASSWAKNHTPLEGEISGCGRFYRSDGDVFYAVPDLPKMEAVRDGMLCELKWGNPCLIPKDDHGYSPHITLCKIPNGETSPKAPPRIPLRFDAISVVCGDVRKDFAFVTPDAVVMRSMSDALRAASTEVQTIIFDKDVFSLDEARKWLSDNGFKTPAVDETEDSYRFRQREPGDFREGSFRTITLRKGVKAVVGIPKGEREEGDGSEGRERDSEDGIASAMLANTTSDAQNPSPAALGSTIGAAASLPPPIAHLPSNRAVSEPILGVSGGTSEVSLPVVTTTTMRSLPYARDIVQPGVTPGEKIAYTAKVEKPMKTSREYRGMVRGLMNLEMDGAEMHGYLAEMDGVPE